MTLGQSDVNELLDAIRAGGDINIIRKGVELVLQALIEAEATEHIGAGRYERTETRTVQRNGHRDRLLATKAGDVVVRAMYERRVPRAPGGWNARGAFRRPRTSGAHLSHLNGGTSRCFKLDSRFGPLSLLSRAVEVH